jgi:hypothetical protein
MAGLVPAIDVLFAATDLRVGKGAAVPTFSYAIKNGGHTSLCPFYFPASFFIAVLIDAAALS